jgi:hypothetical protein
MHKKSTAYKNKVPARIFLLGTLFPTVIYSVTYGKHIFRELVARKEAPSRNTCNKLGIPRFL